MNISSMAKVLLGLLGALWALPVGAQIRVAQDHCLPPPPQAQLFSLAGVRVEYYTLVSDNIEELTREMAFRGPLDDRAMRRDALLSWDIYWHWNVTEQEIPTGVAITKTARLILPLWCPSSPSASIPARAEWDRYLLAVLEHEAGHAIRYLEASRPLESAMRDHLRVCQGCPLREANTLGYSVLARLNISQLQYDQETSHGLTQAARLAPPQAEKN